MPDINPRPRLPRKDSATRVRLDAIQDGYERWARRTTWILSFLVIFQFGLGILSIVLLGYNADRVEDIQTSRKQVTMETCEAQNQRNRNTVKAYDDRIKRALAAGQIDRERRARLSDSRELTVALISALAPEQDCRALVRERFGTTK